MYYFQKCPHVRKDHCNWSGLTLLTLSLTRKIHQHHQIIFSNYNKSVWASMEMHAGLVSILTILSVFFKFHDIVATSIFCTGWNFSSGESRHILPTCLPVEPVLICLHWRSSLWPLRAPDGWMDVQGLLGLYKKDRKTERERWYVCT